MSQYTERYTQYARLSGRTPDEQAAHDDKLGVGRNTDFIVWCSMMWRKFREVHPELMGGEAEHYHFDAWLASLPFEVYL